MPDFNSITDFSLDWHLVVTLFFGALCGYIASRIIGGEGFGFFGNIVVGMLGSIIGNWLVKLFKIPMLSGFFGNLISAVGGALVLIALIEIFKLGTKSRETTTRRKRSTKSGD